jgi:glutamate synthase domain-containing protein 1
VAWFLLLLGLGFWSALRSPATVREQSDLGSAKQVMDEMVGRISGNVPADWQFFDEGYRDESCELTVVRDGRKTTRSLRLTGPPATENDAVSQLATTIGGDDARVKPVNGPAESFFADVGEYVAVRGQVDGPGVIIVQMTSGCRSD